VWQGVELEDFVSGPRELLLKLVEDNYPLPPKPDCFQKGLHLKRLIWIIMFIVYSLRSLLIVILALDMGIKK
jgi:hypothetical protein